MPPMPPRPLRPAFDPAPHRAALVAIIDAVVREPALDARRLDRIVRRHPKHGRGLFSKTEIIAGFRAFRRAADPDEPAFLERLRLRPVRTLSGVTPVTVLTKPFPCPGACIFCPNDVRMPKSYLSDEPGAQRAEDNRFDPYLQTWNRLAAYRSIGHPADKVELIVLGGTWSHHPEPYQIWFVERCLDALNDFGAGADGRAQVGAAAARFRELPALDGRSLDAGRLQPRDLAPAGRAERRRAARPERVARAGSALARGAARATSGPRRAASASRSRRGPTGSTRTSAPAAPARRDARSSSACRASTTRCSREPPRPRRRGDAAGVRASCARPASSCTRTGCRTCSAPRGERRRRLPAPLRRSGLPPRRAQDLSVPAGRERRAGRAPRARRLAALRRRELARLLADCIEAHAALVPAHARHPRLLRARHGRGHARREPARGRRARARRARRPRARDPQPRDARRRRRRAGDLRLAETAYATSIGARVLPRVADARRAARRLPAALASARDAGDRRARAAARSSASCTSTARRCRSERAATPPRSTPASARRSSRRRRARARDAGFRRLAVISAVGTRAYYRRLGFGDGELYQHRSLGS